MTATDVKGEEEGKPGGCKDHSWILAGREMETDNEEQLPLGSKRSIPLNFIRVSSVHNVIGH